MNKTYTYIYAIVITLILILLVIFFIRLKKLMKKIVLLNDGVGVAKDNLDAIKDKTNQIEKSKESYKFFISIYVVFTIIKETISNLKDNKIAKAFTLACLANAKSIKKMKV